MIGTIGLMDSFEASRTSRAFPWTKAVQESGGGWPEPSAILACSEV